MTKTLNKITKPITKIKMKIQDNISYFSLVQLKLNFHLVSVDQLKLIHKKI